MYTSVLDAWDEAATSYDTVMCSTDFWSSIEENPAINSSFVVEDFKSSTLLYNTIAVDET